MVYLSGFMIGDLDCTVVIGHDDIIVPWYVSSSTTYLTHNLLDILIYDWLSDKLTKSLSRHDYFT